MLAILSTQIGIVRLRLIDDEDVKVSVNVCE